MIKIKNDMNFCDYGCGKQAKYILKNGKNCCSKSHNQCDTIKKKNSFALKKAWSKGKRKFKYSRLMNWRKNKESVGYKKWVEIAKTEIFILNPLSIGVDHKKLLVEMFEWKYECNICGIKEWNKTHIVLELDHKNGNNRDFRFQNLRFLCPNCHSQTETFCGKNINSGKFKVNDNTLINHLKNSPNIYQALVKSGLAPKGGNYNRVYKLIEENNIIFKGE